MTGSVIILGAGITGLSAGYKLSEASIPVNIIENDSIIGGMSSCFKYKGYTLDYGPHKIFTQMDNIMTEIKILIGDDLLTVHKKSRILLSGKYYKFPPNVKDLLFGMPLTGLGCAIDYIIAAIKAKTKNSNDNSYESYIVNRFGNGTFNLVFKPYAKKVWGEPKKLSADLAKSRVAAPSIAELILRMIFGDNKKPAISADVFYYPKNGVLEISDKLAEKIKEMSNSISLKTNPVQIDTENKEVIVRNKTGQEISLYYSDIISSIPIDTLINLIKPKAPDTIITAAKSLKHRNLVLIYIVINQDRLFGDSFIFYPEEKYIFNRLSEQKGFSEYMIPKNKTVLCVEITCGEDDEKWKASDEFLYKKAIDGLRDAEIITENEIEEYFVKRLTNAYPVYDINYKRNIEITLDYLDSLGNIYSVGRQGIFNYCGMVDAMDMGFTAAEHIVSEGNGFAWKDRRKKFENYVTVD